MHLCANQSSWRRVDGVEAMIQPWAEGSDNLIHARTTPEVEGVGGVPAFVGHHKLDPTREIGAQQCQGDESHGSLQPCDVCVAQNQRIGRRKNELAYGKTLESM